MKFIIDAVFYQPIYNLLILLIWLMPNNSAGLAIVVVTVLIRLALMPSAIKQAKSQLHMQELTPKINKIKKEITDSTEQSKAIMALYKDEGVSPFGACLPLLIQLPIMIALYSAMRHGLNTGGYAMLYHFIPRPDLINVNFIGFNLTKPDPWVLPILAAGLQIYLSYLMMPKIKKEDQDPKDFSQAMSKQMIFLPAIMTLFFGRTLPSALVIYWIITTLFSIVQQLYVLKKYSGKLSTFSKASKELIKEIEAPLKEKSALVKEIEAPKKKQGFVDKIMANRQNKSEKKAGVNVTVRTKKK
ncbi:MAG: YidC/Oxa1 family membrane protein insertase [Candidatus Berkelbacteria bacterium]